MPGCHLAIDLGAGSGRAFLGRVAEDTLSCREVHRFAYAPRQVAGHLRWDIARLFEGIDDSLRAAASVASGAGWQVTSVGVDSWGVDYGLVDRDGRLVEEPICYRDARTDAALVSRVLDRIPQAELFARTGIQSMPINTLFQLAAHVRDGIPAQAATLLLIPDLCHRLLCGAAVTELTNATTTQLLRAGTHEWDDDLFARLDLPRHLMPEVVDAGAELGTVGTRWLAEAGLAGVRVLAPATHDTGSAVLGTPLTPGAAYISSGTWSLVGVERDTPVLGSAAARANVTNEGGAFGTVRFLKNVMGLWILESCRREWGADADYTDLLASVSALDGFQGFIYPDAPRFLNPPGMVDALRAALAESGQPVPADPPRLARIVLDSLALRYASVIATIERLTGSPIPVIHVVGGGSRNAYLNQATADASGRTVLAGPAEATVLGNLFVQAIASGEIGSIGDARTLLRRSVALQRYQPRERTAWSQARARYAELEAASMQG